MSHIYPFSTFYVEAVLEKGHKNRMIYFEGLKENIISRPVGCDERFIPASHFPGRSYPISISGLKLQLIRYASRNSVQGE